MKLFFLLALFSASLAAVAQQIDPGILTIPQNSTFSIEDSGKLIVQKEIFLTRDIPGNGTLVLNGSLSQTIYSSGHSVPYLEIDNPSNVLLSDLSGALDIRKGIIFSNGKLILQNSDLTMEAGATISGQSSAKYISTNSLGSLVYKIYAPLPNLVLPVGSNYYRPVTLNISGGFSSNASIKIQSVDSSAFDKPYHIANYVNTYWPVVLNGITGGTITYSAQYNAADVSGTSSKLTGYFYNGSEWNSVGGSGIPATNSITISPTSTSGKIFAMNPFVYVSAKAFLLGAFDSASALMTDALRNLLPASDPYRMVTYSSNFVHVNNSISETVNTSVFLNQPSTQNNIVDWVFLELRNTAASPGNSIIQTRSALIKRNGDVVDVDGVSPVCFNAPSALYVITVRHRNHLGLSTDQGFGAKRFDENKLHAITSNKINFTTLDSYSLYGDTLAYCKMNHGVLGQINLLWSGNANGNHSVRYSGPANDASSILSALNGNYIGTLSNVYHPADLNFDGKVKYSGPGNDNNYLLSTILKGNTLTIINEQIPN